MNILISTIIRNEEKHLDRWYNQLKTLVTGCPDINFVLSVYENDSTDNSKSKLLSFDFSFLSAEILSFSNLNFPYFVGGKSAARTEILAFARNRSIYSTPFIQNFDYILVIEPDTEFSFETIEKIVRHEKFYGRKFDVFTGKSVHPGTENIYDSWGTRKTDNQTDWKEEDGQTAGLEPMWSTFNCVALYNAEPIKKGICFGGFNHRLGVPDCDTVVICENFRASGYKEIYWDTNLHITHHCQ